VDSRSESTKTQLRAQPVDPASPYLRDEAAEDEQEQEPQLLLGRYSILEERAAGGFGVVEVCWDVRLQRRVAIKCIPLADDELGAASEADAIAEARVACMLAHPNIVTVFDFACDDAYAYIVMEYVNGVSLSELLARVEGGTLTYDEAAHVLHSVASALAFAHENGVLHMDIKPSNILIDRSGTVKLSDFGMAAMASAAGYGGARGGTVGYMPPEQIVGDYVDERCDVFALGCVLWQAITGHDPFAARDAGESLDKIRRGPQPRLERTDPELAGPVAETLYEALAPEPAQRLADVTELDARITPELGSPEAGRASLVQLLNQLAEDEDPALAPPPRVPVTQAAPWLEGATVRTLSALVAGLAALRLLGPLVHLIFPAVPVPEARMLAAVVCAAAGAVWPPLAAVLVSVGAGASIILVGRTLDSMANRAALGVLCMFVALSWWAVSGRRYRLSSSAILAGCAFASPSCGCALASVASGPAGAFGASALGYLGASFVLPIAQGGWTDAAVATSATTLFSNPGTWVEAVGCGAAAWAGSMLAHRDSTSLAIVGQAVGFVVLAFARSAAQWVENGHIWTLPNMSAMAVALILYVLVSLALALFGAPETDQEV
jgi:hypothetical protein